MIALLADEDFNARIIRGLRRREPELDLVTASEAQLRGTTDATIVSWAAEHARVLITHDVNTLLDAALARVRAGQPMPEVIAVPQSAGIGRAISDLALVAIHAQPDELDGQIWFVPL